MRIFGKKSLIYGALSVAMAFSLVGCTGNEMPGHNVNGSKDENSVSDGSGFDINSEATKSKTKKIENYIDAYFYFEEDAEKQEESYYDGIMAGLDDPYSVYYTPEEYAQLKEDDGGEYEGIGATVSKNYDLNRVYVVKPIVGGPAEKAGILPNDVFVEVDGVNIDPDMELDAVVKLLRGPAGTDVTLKIYREGESDYLTFTFARGKVENITVESELLEGNIGYIKVEQFIENTGDQFIAQIEELQKKGAKSLIVDLRDNPGGLVTTVIQMCDYIVKDFARDDRLLLTTKDKNGTILEEWKCDDNHFVDMPMVVLVNGNSASASEIFTGCMKDYGIATIVGTNTYGKGIVQSVIGLGDGSAIKLTIAKYFTPSGNDIHKVGIAPDVEVELDEEQQNKVTVAHEDDNQLQKAIEILKK